MKKKAGQAQGISRSSDVRSTSLAPVKNRNSSKPSVKPEVSEYAEFDYKSLGKINTGNSVNNGKKNGSSSGKKSSGSSGSRSGSSKNSYGFSKGHSKSGKKNQSGIIIAAVAAVILIAGVIAACIYYFKTPTLFDSKIDVTMADGSVQSIKADAAYAELTTDKFFSGTVIDGIDVGGMTVDEAYSAVTKTLPEVPLNIDVKLDLEGKKLVLDFSDAKFEYNTRQVLDEAFNKYRPASDSDLTQLAECYSNMQRLKNEPQVYETAYTVQIEGITERVNKVLDPYLAEYATVKNASIVEFDTDTCTFVVDKEKEGYAIDVDATAKAVKALFDSKTYEGTVTVPTVKKMPEITEAMINENFGLAGSEYTITSGNNNRNNNIRQACDNMNGTILEPGEVFSFNQVVGQRTTENGFKEATVILGGQYEQGLGGGICQVSTTLYNAVLKANLKIVERHSHAWPSDYISTGLDATVDWPSLDFKFENDTEYQVVVVAWWDSSDNTCHAEIYGKKLPDGKSIDTYAEIVSTTSAGPDEYVEDKELPVGETKTLRAAHQGITANAYKIWYDADGNEISRDFYNSTYYNAYGRRIAVGVLKPDGTYASIDKNGEYTEPLPSLTPSPSPSPSPSPTPADNPTTAPENPTPAADTPTPAADTPTPVPDTPTPEPVEDTPTPVPDTPAPVEPDPTGDEPGPDSGDADA